MSKPMGDNNLHIVTKGPLTNGAAGVSFIIRGCWFYHCFITPARKSLPHNELQIVTIHPLTFPFPAVSIIP